MSAIFLRRFMSTTSKKVHPLTVQTQLFDRYEMLLGDPIFAKPRFEKLQQFYKDSNINIEEVETQWIASIDSELDLYPSNSCLHPSNFPKQESEFLSWFNKVLHEYHLVESKLYTYLQHESSVAELGLYICLEDLIDSKFDDIVAVAQCGITNTKSKMALANNYWDEMGNGDIGLMHSPMFGMCCDWFKTNIFNESIIDFLNNEFKGSWQCLQNGNLSLCYTVNRQYAARLLGCIAVLEDTAHTSFATLVKAMDRLQLPDNVTKYHKLHEELDIQHGRELVEDVCQTLIADAFKLHGEQVGSQFLNQVCFGAATRIVVAKVHYENVLHILDRFNREFNHL